MGASTEEARLRWLDRAEDAMDVGDDARARRFVARVRREAPDMPELLLVEGRLAFVSGDVDRAVERLERAIERAPGWNVPRLLLAEARLHGEDDPESALALSEAVLAGAPSDEERALAGALSAASLTRLERDDEARARLAELAPTDPEDMCEVAHLYEELGDLAKAAAGYAAAVEAAPDFADAWLYLGEVRAAQGRHDEATAAWLECQRLDRAVPRPDWRMSDDEIEVLAEATLLELPEEVRRHLANVPILVEDQPSRALLADGVGPRTLGLFTGTPLPHKSSVGEGLEGPDAARIYVRNLELACADRAELEAQVRITILHETAHFFGLEDEDLEDMGLG